MRISTYHIINILMNIKNTNSCSLGTFNTLELQHSVLLNNTQKKSCTALKRQVMHELF